MRKITIIILAICVSNTIIAQNTTNSPTSMFGIGELATGSGGQYAGMGGVGIALRRNNFLNIANPAALTELDSLNFTIEVGVMAAQKKYVQSGITNNSTEGNVNNIAVGYRILPGWYSAISLTPVSSVGYSITLDQQIEGTNVSTISSYFEGEGGLSRLNFSNAFLIGKRFSIGANLSYIMGKITETETQGSATITQTSNKNACYADVGVQYKYPISRDRAFVAGATYGYSQPLTQNNKLAVSSTTGDQTIDKPTHTVTQYMPQFYGVGIAYTSLKWTFAADYKYIEWSRMKSSENTISYSDQSDFKIGGAYVLGSPYKRPVKLMLGAGINDSYVLIKKNKSQNYFVSTGLGITLRNKNSLSLGIKYGDQIGVSNNMPHERSVSVYFNLSFSEHTYRGKLQ
ncbi:hypothetical protein [uncultured Bacteroides sp.]|uniref:hypothetical protein n=1 Tax=uncultured Bacteroides sp. TaxID=162156 RepID=UPI002AA708D0|nr:hypothetical protein [uncultured Bacteroides sp.]